MLQTAALILAAGKGTRMHSDKPKVLQTVLGEPMLRYVLEAVRPVFDGRVLVVVGHQAGMVEAAFPDAAFVRQEQQLGTGHALMQAMPALEGQCERVLVVNGDTPLLSEDVVRHFVEASAGADLAFATIELDDPAAYGRVVRAAGGGGPNRTRSTRACTACAWIWRPVCCRASAMPTRAANTTSPTSSPWPWPRAARCRACSAAGTRA